MYYVVVMTPTGSVLLHRFFATITSAGRCWESVSVDAGGVETLAAMGRVDGEMFLATESYRVEVLRIPPGLNSFKEPTEQVAS